MLALMIVGGIIGYLLMSVITLKILRTVCIGGGDKNLNTVGSELWFITIPVIIAVFSFKFTYKFLFEREKKESGEKGEKRPDHVRKMMEALKAHNIFRRVFGSKSGDINSFCYTGAHDDIFRDDFIKFKDSEYLREALNNIYKVKFDEVRKICNSITISVERWALLESIDRKESWSDLEAYLMSKFEELNKYYQGFRDSKLSGFKVAIKEEEE